MDTRLKVLHIITRLIIGGAQENTLFTAELLDSDIFDVDVLCGPQTGPEGSLIADARKRNINLFIEKNLVREIRPIKDFFIFFRLIYIIKKNAYQIVHTHSSKAGILGRWAAWFAGCPVIIHTVHGWGFHDYQRPWLRNIYILLERLTLKITTKLIAVTRKDIEKGVGAGIGKNQNYTLIRSGIELDRFKNPKRLAADVRSELGIPQDAKIVGTVTRLSPQKAPLIFLQIAALVLEREPNTFFVMVGDGPLRDEIEIRARELGINGHLILTGLRRDVPELLQLFDLFVLTSLWEGLPRVIPQAMAAGIPVIASMADGNAEIITNNENGLLVKPNNIEDSVDTILKTLNDAEKRKRLSENAQSGLDEYGVQTMIENLEKLYQNQRLIQNLS
jgi:glycosyltransferase involved in cell wall biosynthesis